MCSVFVVTVWMELLFLRRRGLHIPSNCGTFGASDDVFVCGSLSLYIQYVDERLLWSHDGYRNDRSP